MKLILIAVVLITQLLFFFQPSSGKIVRREIIPQEMTDRILSYDYHIAMAALEENRRQKNSQAVCLSLKHRSLVIRRLAAEALGELQAKSSVQCLIEALENNQTVLLGGSETVIEQDMLNEAIIGATEKITGLELKYKKSSPKKIDRVASRKQVRAALEKIKTWQTAQKEK